MEEEICETEEKRSQVETELVAQAKLLEELNEVIERLEVKIKAVLMPGYPSDIAEKENEKVIVPLASELRNNNKLLSYRCNYIRQITDRVEA